MLFYYLFYSWHQLTFYCVICVLLVCEHPSNLILIPGASYLTFLSVSLSFSLPPKAFRLFSFYPWDSKMLKWCHCVEFCLVVFFQNDTPWDISKRKNMSFISRKFSYFFDTFFLFSSYFILKQPSLKCSISIWKEIGKYLWKVPPHSHPPLCSEGNHQFDFWV